MSEAGGERQEAEGSEMEKRRSKREEKAPQTLLCSPAPGVGGGGGCFFVCVWGGGGWGVRTKKKKVREVVDGKRFVDKNLLDGK